MVQVKREIRTVKVVETKEVPLYDLIGLTANEYQVLRNALYSMGQGDKNFMLDNVLPGQTLTQQQIACMLLATLPMVRR